VIPTNLRISDPERPWNFTYKLDLNLPKSESLPTLWVFLVNVNVVNDLLTIINELLSNHDTKKTPTHIHHFNGERPFIIN
jgi:hypothetical protein